MTEPLHRPAGDGLGAAPATRYVLLSHKALDCRVAVAASVYQAFVGCDRITDLAGYVDTTLPDEEFREALARMPLHGASLLINGALSVFSDNAVHAAEFAATQQIPVTIYWHETAWTLRSLVRGRAQLLGPLIEALSRVRLTNWVVSSQSLHAVATLFGFPIETFRIVYEIVDLKRFQPPAGPRIAGPIIVAGAGASTLRKGVDRFSAIAHAVSQPAQRPVEFRWFGAMPQGEAMAAIPYPEAVRWMGAVVDFERALREVDIFLLSSRDDPAPLVAFEALASGCPVYCFGSTGFAEILPSSYVASDVDGMIERIAGAVDGFAPDPDKYRDIAERFGVGSFAARAFRPPDRLVAPLPNSSIPGYVTRAIELQTRVDELSRKNKRLRRRLDRAKANERAVASREQTVGKARTSALSRAYRMFIGLGRRFSSRSGRPV